LGLVNETTKTTKTTKTNESENNNHKRSQPQFIRQTRARNIRHTDLCRLLYNTPSQIPQTRISPFPKQFRRRISGQNPSNRLYPRRHHSQCRCLHPHLPRHRRRHIRHHHPRHRSPHLQPPGKRTFPSPFLPKPRRQRLHLRLRYEKLLLRHPILDKLYFLNKFF